MGLAEVQTPWAKCDKDATGAGRMKPWGDHFLTLDFVKCFIGVPHWRVPWASCSGFQFPPVGQAFWYVPVSDQ